MLLLLSCGRVTADPATLDHRPVAEACGPPPSCAPEAADTGCTDDGDCADGERGACLPSAYGCFCSYYQCVTDADCSPDAACRCGTELSPSSRCVDADCRVDADCPTGRCQASPGGHCGVARRDEELPIGGWFCASPLDACNSDDDCPEEEQRCMFSDGRFQCSWDYAITCD